VTSLPCANIVRTLDPHALRLACLWERSTACRDSTETGDDLDAAASPC
jgi:hypothetical protein